MNGIIVTDNDGDVGNESWQQNWQSDSGNDYQQGNCPPGKMESFVTFKFTSGALGCIGCLMTLKRGFKRELLAFSTIFDGLRPDGEKAASDEAANSVDKFKSAHDSNAEVGLWNAEVEFTLNGEVEGRRRCLSLPISWIAGLQLAICYGLG